MKTKPIIKNFLTRAAMTLAERMTRSFTMMLLMLMTAATAWAAQPVTNLDACRGEAYSIYVKGWAFDPDARDWGLDVKVYVYTDAACQNEYTYKKLATGDARPDVVTVHSLPSGSKPGFEGRIPITDPGTYYVKVYAIDIDQWGDDVENSSTEMSNSFNPVTVTTLTTIGSAADWNTFVTVIKSGEDFAGKTLTLTADIPTAEEIAAGTTAVTTITGEEKAFCGTFDGQGHTINVDLNVSGNEAAGLFSYVKGATIKNLTVTGTINNTGMYAGGLVGTAKGATIQNCTLAATINSSGNEVGAFVGGCSQIDADTPGNLTLQDCVFSGSIHYTGSFSCKAAGLVNVWNNTSLNIRNCLVSGSFTSERSGSQFYPIAFKTAGASVTANVNATYYLNTLPSSTSEENVISGAEGLPVIANETADYYIPVTAADGLTYYYYFPLTTVTSSTTEWTDGLYAVTNDVTISSRITVNGTVILFLGEGVTLNARWGIGVGSGNTLTIEGSGTLQTKGTSYEAAIGGTTYIDSRQSEHGHIIIQGGNIIAQGGDKAAGIGGGLNSTAGSNSIVDINGGVVNATGGLWGAGIGGGFRDWYGSYGASGIININGGQVTARGGNSAPGIGRGFSSTDTSGSLTLGWTHESDFIDVDSYEIGSISFAEGKKFIIDGEEILATVENIGGKKIIPLVANNWPSPIDLTVINFTDKTAKLTWTAPETTNAITGYAYQYKDVNESTWSDEVTMTETTVTISGLTARTDYAFRVKALYGSDASGFELLNFTTAPSLPYEQGFEDGMDGWKEIENDPQGYGTIQAGLKHEGNNSYKFMFYSGSSGNQYLISPNLGGATGLRVSFYHLADNICDQFQIGYSTSTDDITAFTWGDVTIGSLGWKFHTEYFPEGTKYVAVKAFSTAGSNSSIYFDDFIFKDANIKEPVNLAVSEVSESSVTLTWEAPETPYTITGYDYQYKNASESDWTSGSTTDTSVTIDGLSADTDYQFRVKALYDSDASIVVSLNFTTTISLPHEQGFENGMGHWGMVNCNVDWGAETDYPMYTGIRQQAKFGGEVGFQFYRYRDDNDKSIYQYLISPRLPGSAPVDVTFSVRTIDECIENFRVGYSTSTNDISAFAYGTNCIVEDAKWYQFQGSFPAGAKYIIIKYLSNNRRLYIDDIVIKEKTYDITLDDNADNAAVINDYKGKCVNATLQDRTFYRDGDWNTLTVPFDVNDFTGTPLEGATVKTLSSSAFSNGTLTLNFEDATSIEAGKPYIVKWDEGVNLTINSTADWNAFAESVNGGKSFAGKTVLLGADISGVSTMVGTAEHPFRGIFEGAGHTLNVSISGGEGAAPFHYINGATIRNVKTTGTVSGGNHSAGLVGIVQGGTNSIRDCHVSATVSTSGSYVGGILGNGTTSTTTISNCMFSGYLTAANMGILYGWGEEGGTHTVENCVAYGTYADLSIIIDEGDGRSIDLLLGNGTKTVANCWKNKDVGSQGNTDVYTWSGGTHPLIYNYLGSQWTYENNNFVLSPTVNIVGTNIENPTFVDVRISTTASPVETTWVDFVGTYEPLSFSDADPSILFLGTESTLYYPLSGAYIGAQRAYFRLKGIAAGDTHNQARAFVLNFGDSETTGILSTTNLTNDTNSDAWYDLSGRRLNGKPTQKGLYINNGCKVVIK